MNEETTNSMSRQEDDDSGVRLMQIAGPRKEIESDRDARIHTAVHKQWLLRVTSRRRMMWRSAIGLAAAAGVVGAITLTLWYTEAQTAPEGLVAFAQVELASGDVWQSEGSADRRFRLRKGDRLEIGNAVVTTDGRVAFRLASGHSVRLDRDSGVRLAAANEVILEQGAVYLDSGGMLDEDQLITIRTPLGGVTEIGTQFEVRLLEEGVRVRVREGRIAFFHDSGRDEFEAGRQARLDGSGRLVVDDIPRFGIEWEWVAETTPAYQLEGQTLKQYLTWLSRETGFKIGDPEGRLEGADVEAILHGQLPAIRPEQTTEFVLPTCELQASVSNGVLVIRGAGK
ncbi:MAG: FecR domain-containing protein [bacterium]|nr:FecR domain-containing protein [bacterium]